MWVCEDCGKEFSDPTWDQVESHPSFYEVPLCPFCYAADITDESIILRREQ